MSSLWRAPTVATHARSLARFARVDVLVIDDFALAPMNDHQRQDLLEVLENRYGTRSTVVTSQLSPDGWHEYIGEPTVADAICDRLLHGAHRLDLKGPSRRKEDKTTE
jgi:DNA replication protein DnaC